jgi:hypothetical protein
VPLTSSERQVYLGKRTRQPTLGASESGQEQAFSNHPLVRLAPLADGPVLDLVTSRAHSIKRSATGLKLLFFSVTIATGHGRTGKSTCNALSP